MTWALELLGSSGLLLIGLLAPLLVWIGVGLYGKFDSKAEREGWLHGGVMGGVLLCFLLLAALVSRW